MDYQAPHTHLQAPMSQEAEQALLGSILIEPKAFLSVASILTADDFFIKRHEYIWNALSRLQERNDAIDYLTLTRELQDMGLLDEIGGQAYLTSLANSTPTAIHAEVYGEMVARTSTRRKMLQAADNIRQLALDEALPIDKVVDEAEQALFAVSNSQAKREFVPIWDAASEYYDEMEKLLEIGAGAIGMPTGFREVTWTVCSAAFKSQISSSSRADPAWAKRVGCCPSLCMWRAEIAVSPSSRWKWAWSRWCSA